MPAASRIQLVPPEPWGEEQLLHAARALTATGKPVRPGDAVGELVVVGVEPEPGATLADDTEMEVVPSPRRADAPRVDVVVLLDTSESMGTPWDARHTRLSAAREALATFLRAPGAAVASLAVFEYAKEPRLVAGPAEPSRVPAPPPSVPKGPAATARALNAALAHLAARAERDRCGVILLLTDGVGEVEELPATGERAARLRVPVHALVFAPEVDEAFDTLARPTNGTAQTATHPLTIEFEHQPGGNAS